MLKKKRLQLGYVTADPGRPPPAPGGERGLRPVPLCDEPDIAVHLLTACLAYEEVRRRRWFSSQPWGIRPRRTSGWWWNASGWSNTFPGRPIRATVPLEGTAVGLQKKKKDATQTLRQLLHPWKSLMEITACPRVLETMDKLTANRSVLHRLCPALCVCAASIGRHRTAVDPLSEIVLTSADVGRQKHDNGTTVPEYECQQPFVWIYIQPRFLCIMGWFCPLV